MLFSSWEVSIISLRCIQLILNTILITINEHQFHEDQSQTSTSYFGILVMKLFNTLSVHISLTVVDFSQHNGIE